MDSRKQALTDLLAKVEAGEHPTGSFLLHMRSAFPHHDKLAHATYNGSLDAAMALHKALPTKAIMDAETMAIILFGKNGPRHFLAWKIKALIAEVMARHYSGKAVRMVEATK